MRAIRPPRPKRAAARTTQAPGQWDRGRLDRTAPTHSDAKTFGQAGQGRNARPNQENSATARPIRNAPSCQRLRPGPDNFSPDVQATPKHPAARARQRMPAARGGASPGQANPNTSTTAKRNAKRANAAVDGTIGLSNRRNGRRAVGGGARHLRCPICARTKL